MYHRSSKRRKVERAADPPGGASVEESRSQHRRRMGLHLSHSQPDVNLRQRAPVVLPSVSVSVNIPAPRVSNLPLPAVVDPAVSNLAAATDPAAATALAAATDPAAATALAAATAIPLVSVPVVLPKVILPVPTLPSVVNIPPVVASVQSVPTVIVTPSVPSPSLPAESSIVLLPPSASESSSVPATPSASAEPSSASPVPASTPASVSAASTAPPASSASAAALVSATSSLATARPPLGNSTTNASSFSGTATTTQLGLTTPAGSTPSESATLDAMGIQSLIAGIFKNGTFVPTASTGVSTTTTSMMSSSSQGVSTTSTSNLPNGAGVVATGAAAAPSSTAGSGNGGSGSGSSGPNPTVVGGVVGGLAGLALILILALILLRMKKHSRDREAERRLDSEAAPVVAGAAGAGETPAMTDRSSSSPFVAAWRSIRPISQQTASTNPSEGGERGFVRISGRHLPRGQAGDGYYYGDLSQAPMPPTATPPRTATPSNPTGPFGAAKEKEIGGGVAAPAPLIIPQRPARSDLLTGTPTSGIPRQATPSSLYAEDRDPPLMTTHRSPLSASATTPGSAFPPLLPPQPASPATTIFPGAGGYYPRDSSASRFDDYRSSGTQQEHAVLRSSPARTPVMQNPNMASAFPVPPRGPPAASNSSPVRRGSPVTRTPTGSVAGQDGVGRSHASYDGSRSSRFTEDVI